MHYSVVLVTCSVCLLLMQPYCNPVVFFLFFFRVQARSDLEAARQEERARIQQQGEFKANQAVMIENANLQEANKNYM
jgi:hypothetical protein